LLKPILVAAVAATVLSTAPRPVAAQAHPAPLAVGDSAPDFTLPVGTRDGILPLPAKLRDFRGQTVVLAFFYKARTGG
jgi:thioredoxin-dependent peroxiredoxin